MEKIEEIDLYIIQGSLDTVVKFQDSLFNEKVKKVSQKELLINFFMLQYTLPRSHEKDTVNKIMTASVSDFFKIIKNTDFRGRRAQFNSMDSNVFREDLHMTKQ